MAELRKDYLTEEWVCLSEVRHNRPHMGIIEKVKMYDGVEKCPFCLENKHMTPPEVDIVGETRVIPNLYPILDKESPNGFGFHEVIIDTPNHNIQIKDYTINQVVHTFKAIQNRIVYYKSNNDIRYIQIFKNQGANAGATIYHPHWQIVAMPFVPLKKHIMNNNFNKYFNENKTKYNMLKNAKAEGRLVLEKGGIVCFVPYANTYYLSYNITSMKQTACFSNFDEENLRNIADILIRALGCTDKLFPGVSYNICFHTQPFFLNEKEGDNWIFFLQVIPRIGNFAGFEISTGCFINSVRPEVSAEKLRSCL